MVGNPAHPRVGGENPKTRSEALPDPGSSPRGRGKPSWTGGWEGESRLIPAWAGKTLAGFPLPMTQAAHPRVGGENPKTRSEALPDPGSSPRGRGKPNLTIVTHAT